MDREKIVEKLCGTKDMQYEALLDRALRIMKANRDRAQMLS